MSARLATVILAVLGLARFVTAGEPLPPEFKAELQQLLRVAEARGPKAAGNAQRRYDAARAVRDDGRADYAFALVLLRLNKTKDATAALAQAADLAPAPYLPACRAEVALLLQQRQWTTALARMERFGRALTATPHWWTSDEERLADAARLGRAVSVAQLAGSTAAEIERFVKLDQAQRTALMDDLRAAYGAGFDAVVNASEQSAEMIAAAEATSQAAREAEQAEARDKVKNQKAQASGNRENLKLTAEEWKKYLDDRLAEFGKQLGTLEKQLNQLDQKRQSLERSILPAQREQQILLSAMQASTSSQSSGSSASANRKTLTATQVQQIDRELNLLQQQINQYEQERNRVLTDMNAGRQQGLLLLAQRQSLVADYERATGKLVQQDEALMKFNERLSQKEKDLAEPLKGKAASVRLLEQKRKSPATFLPMDWETERQRWLQELSS